MTPQDPLRREPRTVATMRLREALDMERETSGGNAMTPLRVAGFIGGPWLDYIAEPYLTATGTETNCPLEGVHEHAFRGPHRFREWEPGT